VATEEQFYEHAQRELDDFGHHYPPDHPVFVPSKGRAGKSTTAHLLEEAKVPFYMVVEPQEAYEYQAWYDRVLVLPENDRGIAFSRNWILDWAQVHYHRYAWQLDDDLKALYHRSKAGQSKVVIADALSYLEAVIGPYPNIGGACFRNAAFAYTFLDKPSVTLNSMVYGFELLRTDARRFRETDMDYSLQLLTEGWVTVTSNRIVQTTPDVGKSGGHAGDYAEDGRKQMYERLMDQWPGVFNLRFNEKSGRWHCTPKPGTWKQFTQLPEDS
jgi:hypothetical protein